MKKKFIYLLLSLLIFSCKKEETTISLKDKLIKHTWKSTGLKVNDIDEDKWCWLNNLYNFTADNKVFITTGDNLGACLSTIPIGTIKKYTYSISSDEKWIITNITGNSEIDSFQVISIDDNTLKTKRIVNKDTPNPSTWEDTFTAIP